ncbi:hypothetical protein [Streptomyces sp. NPDC058401]|uniref:hypothetical protein n=1 Tax=Streptomyces sp. NPDC058401 TaxID=3346480 RepID=UPI00365CF997
MSRKKVALITAGVLVTLGGATAVAVPMANDWLANRHQETSAYATGAEAKSKRPSVPRWLPDEAQSVRYSMKTTGGERLLKATLPDGKLPARCTPAPASTAKEIQLRADWFPKEARDKAALSCATYFGYLDGDTLYAWQHQEDLVAGERVNRES